MIITLTTNPALDRTLIVPHFRQADVTRVRQRHDAAGGKGLNVTRAIRALDTACLAIAPLGGMTGQQIIQLARNEQMNVQVVEIYGETRTCLLVTDLETPDQLVINDQGPMMTESEWQSLRQAVVATCSGSDARWLTISGSLPPSIKPLLLRQLIDAVPATCAVALDTSGAPLALCLDAQVGLLKVNAEELAQATGTTIVTHDDAVAVARQVCQRGPKIVAVTLGASGAIAVTPTEAWYVNAPEIRAISPVGSGDCTLAGMMVALHRGDGLDIALRLGVACGSANALQPYAAVFDRAVAEQFFDQLVAVPL